MKMFLNFQDILLYFQALTRTKNGVNDMNMEGIIKNDINSFASLYRNYFYEFFWFRSVAKNALLGEQKDEERYLDRHSQTSKLKCFNE